MLYRPWKNLNISLSALGFGGAAISGEGGGYGFGPISDEESLKLLHYVFDMGVNLFDTAPIYGLGLAEKRMGAAFATQSQREKIFLMSKGGVHWHPNGRVNLSNHPQKMEEMLHMSLRNLGTEYLDFYLIHHPDPQVDIRFPMEVLVKAKDQGKIRWIGLANTDSEDLRKALEVGSIELVQNEWNLLSPPSARELFPLLQERSIGMVGYGTLDKGLLAGGDEKKPYHPTDIRSWAPWLKEKHQQWKRPAVEALRGKMQQWGIGNELLPLALHFSLGAKCLQSALVGGRSPKQWDSLLQALEFQQNFSLPFAEDDESLTLQIQKLIDPFRPGGTGGHESKN